MKASLRREHYRNYVCAHISPLCCDLSTGPLGEHERLDRPTQPLRDRRVERISILAISNSMELATSRLDTFALSLSSRSYRAMFALISAFSYFPFFPPFITTIVSSSLRYCRVFQFRYAFRIIAAARLALFIQRRNGFRDFAQLYATV